MSTTSRFFGKNYYYFNMKMIISIFPVNELRSFSFSGKTQNERKMERNENKKWNILEYKKSINFKSCVCRTNTNNHFAKTECLTMKQKMQPQVS